MTQAIGSLPRTIELRAPGMTKMQEIAKLMWLPMFAMGLMVLIATLVIGGVESVLSADLFDLDKAAREGVNATTSTLDKQQFIESTRLWLPRFQLLGMGLLFGGITFLLATILGNLRLYGGLVQEKSGRKVLALTPPWSAQVFPIIMMAGLMVLIVSLVVSIVVAFVAGDVYANPISTINSAGAGSGLLDDFQTVKTFAAWLQSLAFVGLALVLSGITLALYTIAQVLRFQHERIAQLAEGAE